jgi:hypothetical protein
LDRAIARDPAMFPDPESFNPLRWVEPGYPTYKEPLTEYPTIINCTQFGYGRRVCQGQTVADEDLLIGIGSMAWLFNIGGLENETSPLVSEPTAVTDAEKVDITALGMNEKASVSTEELNTGVEPRSPTLEDVLISKYSYPGTWPAQTSDAEKPVMEQPKVQEKAKIDPTLDFTTLLIAKPVPFKFHLYPRDNERVSKVRDMYDEGLKRGDYKGSREFWGENHGQGKPFGWGKV